MYRYFIFLSLLFHLNLSAQEIPRTAEELEKLYQENIRKSRINGIYIPTDIGDAIDELIRLSPPESIENFKNGEEDFVVKRLHFGLGKWIAVNWNFEEGSRYSHYLRGMGITFPDDMISFTLRSLHRHLNARPMELRERAEAIKLKRKLEQEERIKKGEVIDTLGRV